jgi:hypothetical protein
MVAVMPAFDFLGYNINNTLIGRLNKSWLLESVFDILFEKCRPPSGLPSGQSAGAAGSRLDRPARSISLGS